MKTDKNRLFFYIGTSLLMVAILEVTILPFIVNNFFPQYFITEKTNVWAVGAVYFFGCAAYLFSSDSYKKQVTMICIFFLYYIIFQFLLRFS